MNDAERATFNEIKTVLSHSVETSVRLSRADDDARAEDYPLLDSEDQAAVPGRALPAVKASCQRLRELAASGNRIHVDAALAGEALQLVPSFPRRWTLPRLDPAELAARVPR